MKNNRNKIIGFFVLLLLVISTIFFPKYNQLLYVTRHALIFMFASYVIVFILMFIYKTMIKHRPDFFVDQRLKFLRIFTVVTFGLLLMTTSFLQLRYIQLVETPEAIYTLYYDNYGNYIHTNIQAYLKPEIDVIENTDDILHVKFVYVYGTEPWGGYSKSNDDAYWTQPLEAYSVVDINIMYDSSHRIISYQNQTSTNYAYTTYINLDRKDISDIQQHYSSGEINITYTYDTNNVFTRRTIYMMDEIKAYTNISNLSHYDFSNTEPSQDNQYFITVYENSESYKSFGVKQNDELIDYINGEIRKENDSLKLSFETDSILDGYPRSTYTYMIDSDEITYDGTYYYMTDQNVYLYNQEFDVYHLNIQNSSNEFYDIPINYQYLYEKYDLSNVLILENSGQVIKFVHNQFGYQIENYFGDGTIGTHEDLYDTFDFIFSYYDRFLYANSFKLGEDGYGAQVSFNPMIKYLLEDMR